MRENKPFRNNVHNSVHLTVCWLNTSINKRYNFSFSLYYGPCGFVLTQERSTEICLVVAALIMQHLIVGDEKRKDTNWTTEFNRFLPDQIISLAAVLDLCLSLLDLQSITAQDAETLPLHCNVSSDFYWFVSAKVRYSKQLMYLQSVQLF